MKYTNKHLKNSYKPIVCLIWTGVIIFMASSALFVSGFIFAKKQMGNIHPLETVLTEYSNSANKVAYIEIVKVPEKISEDQYEGYYIVTTDSDNYISGMQEEQFETLKKEVEEKGKARLEGFTKVVIDKQVIEDAKLYLNEDCIHIRVTELTYGNVLKEGYIVNLILGGLVAFVGAIIAFWGMSQLNNYKHPEAEKIDEECNRKDAVWLNDYKIYLTNSYIVTTDGGISTIDIGSVVEVKLLSVWENNKTITKLVCRTNQKKTVDLYVTSNSPMVMFKEDVDYVKDVFHNRNIKFKCTIDLEDEYE